MPDQIYGVSWNGEEKVSYTYDSLGRLTNKATNGINTAYTYIDIDNSDKTTTLLNSVSTAGITHLYEYDELGNITSVSYASKSNNYEYDELNQLVRENLGYENVTYTYEYENGNIKYKHKYNYTTGTLPSTPRSTIEYYYEDDVWGDVLTKITETSYSNSSYSGTSTYSLRDTSSANTLVHTLFGNNYNTVDLTENAVVTVGDGDLDSLSIASADSSFTETRYTIESDEIGNITSFNDIELGWNGRRLESVSQNGTELISYDYNIDGQRVKKTVNGVTTEYFYNGDILAGQKKGNDTIIFMYDNNGDIFGFTYNGEPYYYVKNAQNDVFLIIDENGEAKVLYQYDAWGKVTACLDGTDFSLSTVNPITYRSYYVDLEMGMYIYYLNSRYYIADWGRFVSADNLLDNRGMTTQNLFQYCANNPVMYVDTSGHALESIFDVVTLCISVVDVIANPTDPWAWLGLAGDIVDLIPFVTGVGEATKGLRIASKAIDAADAAYDAVRTGDKISDSLTTIYRSVSKAEADDIINTGKFNLPVGGMESKQFGFELTETINFGNKMGQNIVVSAKIPTNMLDNFYLGGKGGIDTKWFPSGTLTVYGDQLSDFNKAVSGTIKFME